MSCYSKIRKASTNKLESLFEQEGWCVDIPSSSTARNILPASFKSDSLSNVQSPAILFPRNNRTNLSSESSQSSFSAQTDEEYGYYDDFADDKNPQYIFDDSTAGTSSIISNKSASKLIPSNTPPSSVRLSSFSTLYSSRRSSNGDLFTKKSNSNVLYLLEDHQAELACRSFGSSEGREKLAVCVALAGIRISIRHHFEIAEYKVRLLIENEEFVAWKSYDDFQPLGEACRWHLQSRAGPGASKYSLRNTVNAWNEVVQHRPWFWNTNGLPFLLEESKLLERFLKELLFEIPCIQILVAFMEDD